MISFITQDNFRRFLLVFFLISLILLFSFYVGDVRFTLNRVFMLILFFPLLLGLAKGALGKFNISDLFLLLFCSWVFLSYIVNQGAPQVYNATITIVETMCPYLLARYCVRSLDLYRFFVVTLFYILVLFSILVSFEAFFGLRVFSSILSFFGEITEAGSERRFGLFRSDGPFEHPILYGIFCSATFGLLFFLPRHSSSSRAGFRLAWVSIWTTFLSLSMGAFLSILVQCGLALWRVLFLWLRSRWFWLAAIVTAFYLVLDILSNRSPFELWATYATFDAGNAWHRIWIFEYGLESIKTNPVFGFGECCWVRPNWINTVDNFWLLIGMRHGIPAFFFVLVFWLSIITRLSMLGPVVSDFLDVRFGLIISYIGIGVAIATVHIWGPTYVFVFFLLGCGSWLFDRNGEEASDSGLAESFGAEGSVYTRFPRKSH